MNHKERQELNNLHAKNPTVGDYWEEMFAPACVVIGVTKEAVSLCDKTKSVTDTTWTWDLSQTRQLSRDEFSRWLRYQSPEMSDRTWCNVHPRQHTWARKAAAEILLGT